MTLLVVDVDSYTTTATELSECAGVGKAAELACAGNALGVCCAVLTPGLCWCNATMCGVHVVDRRKRCMGCVRTVIHEHSLQCQTVASSSSTALQHAGSQGGCDHWSMGNVLAEHWGHTVACAADRRLSPVYPEIIPRAITR